MGLDNDGYRVHRNPDGSYVFVERARSIRPLWSAHNSRTINAYLRDHGIKHISYREEFAGLEWSEELPKIRHSWSWRLAIKKRRNGT